MKRYSMIMAILAIIFIVAGPALADSSDLVINEIMYNPASGQDMSDTYYEYVEIYNNGPDAVDLEGINLCNFYSDPNGDTLYAFGSGDVLNADDYLIIARNADSMTSSSHYSVDPSKVYGNFYQGNLGNSAGNLVLSTATGAVIDSVYYYDGDYDWPSDPDNGGPSCEFVNPDWDNNVGTSWLASNDNDPNSPGSPAAINTVYSGGNQPPIISNIVRDPENPGVGEDCEVSATITDMAMALSVSNADLLFDTGSGYTALAMSNVADSFFATIPGQSEGTTVTYYIVAWDDSGDSTVSATDSYYVTDITHQFGDVIFNEIMYSPPGNDGAYEWVELYNPDSLNAVNMSGWVFKDNYDAHEFIIPSGTEIQPNDYIIISVDPDSFADRYPDVVGTVVGPFDFGLNNSGDDTRLYAADGTIIDSVSYDNGGSWPTTGSGGPSIELKNENYDRNDGNSWAGSLDSLGTPMAQNSTWEPGDITGPDATNAFSTGPSTVRVYFSEDVDETTAEDIANYNITQSPGGTIAIYSATLDTTGYIVDLVTDPMNGGSQEMLVVDGVYDLNNNPMPDPDTLNFRGGITPIINVQTPVDPGNDDTSQLVGETVTVKGVATCDSTDLTSSGAYWYIEDTSYSFAYGVKIYSGFNAGIKEGDNVIVAGVVNENYGETNINLDYYHIDEGKVQFGEHAVYPASEVSASQCIYNGVNSEMWEGCLIRLFNMQLIADDFGHYGNNLLFVDAATGTDSVEFQLYPHSPTYTIGEGYTITGIMSYSWDHYVIRFRGNDEDLLMNTGDAMIAMEPINPPIQVSAPGVFHFNGHLINTAGLSWTNDVWIQLDVPGIGRYQLDVYHNITVPAYSSITYFNVAQDIPGVAPEGSYTYYAFVGDYPDVKLDSAYFDFDVIAPAGKGGSWHSYDWRMFDKEVNGLENVPNSFALNQNYPNPFNATTTINFQLPTDNDVTLDVYNLLGQKVTTLINGHINAGYHTVQWDASHYSSGVYFYSLKAGNFHQVKKLMLLK